ncbi:MAG: type II secretion system protein [Planctomycetota bacterium]
MMHEQHEQQQQQSHSQSQSQSQSQIPDVRSGRGAAISTSDEPAIDNDPRCSAPTRHPVTKSPQAAHASRSPRQRDCPGFTLVEILIVVVILGILAAMVIASTSTTTREASQTSFVQTCKNFTQAAILYKIRTGQFLEDSSSGDVPTGFADYIDERAWERGPVIGGVWDAELNSHGITSAIGVHFNNADDAKDDVFMAEVDAMLDDGVLTTGGFRKIANERFYSIIAP